MKKLCIFDLDGTLASTLESMAVAANRVLREMNLPEQPTESFKYFAGDGAKELCRRCLRAAGDAECSQYEEMYRKYREYFSETCMYKVVPYEGIPELLEKLLSSELTEKLMYIKEEPQNLKSTELSTLQPHFLSFRGAGGKEGIMLAVVLGELEIQTPGRVVHVGKPVLAITSEPSALGEEYGILLNSRLLH